MPIRSNIVSTNIFHHFMQKITIYVINFTKNPNIFKIKRDDGMCIYTLITDGLQPIKLLLFKELYIFSNSRWLTTNQIASFQKLFHNIFLIYR